VLLQYFQSFNTSIALRLRRERAAETRAETEPMGEAARSSPGARLNKTKLSAAIAITTGMICARRRARKRRKGGIGRQALSRIGGGWAGAAGQRTSMPASQSFQTLSQPP